MLQIWNHIYSRQLWIIICVGLEPYVGCEPFVRLLTEMLRHFVRVLIFMLLSYIECYANVFLTLINEFISIKKKWLFKN